MNGREAVRLSLPTSLRKKLLEFRKRVWTVKSIEAMSIAVLGIFAAFLTVYFLDRFFDTPSQIRGLLLLAALLVCCVVPWAFYRWIWKRRRLDQLAMLLRHKHPSIGDQLLGIIELVNNEEEQARSRELCEAAVAQVAEEAQNRDLTNAVPNPRHALYSRLAGGGFIASLALLTASPAATSNAWSRYLMPWRDTPRYTFTMLEPQADQQVVPHGEFFPFELQLSADTRWRPDSAYLQIGNGEPMEAGIENNRYRFECPPQLADSSIEIKVGDFSQQIAIVPTVRPELTHVKAELQLPDYLQRTENLTKDVRSGAGTFVSGSKAKISAVASRSLAAAAINDKSVTASGASLVSDWFLVEGDKPLSIEWRDTLGLSGQKPFDLVLHSRDDEAPSIVCEGLPRQRVILDSETLSFRVRAADDFGVKQIGFEWKGFDITMNSSPTQGERLLGAGSPTSEEVNMTGTFSAKALGIPPQPLQIRMFTEDYLPDRERVYSPTYTLYVLSPEDHAIWLTDQLSKWHRHSLEVRDRELQLYETNKRLRDLDTAKLNDPNTRRDIERQAAAERTNGRRLNRLTSIGEELVKQASRNEEFGVGHLEKWAEMLQTLKDISANRMPSVADLLKQASQAEQMAATDKAKSKASPPMVGQNRMPPGKASASSEDGDGKKKPAIPVIVDSESSQQPTDPDEEASEPSESKSGAGRLTLPVTTLAGKGGNNDTCPAEQKLDEAVTEQRDLLNEFEKVAEELNKILANLEGSTLVKRLKAVSRTEYKIAGRLGDSVSNAFGVPSIPEGEVKLFEDLSTQQADTIQTVSYIMDDMQAYYERRRIAKFKAILDEMEDTDVLGALRDVTDEIDDESGVTMAQCEFWSDTFDRWAEDLVDPAGGGT